jgi:POT family proton-dependent oligopeptide transporter
VVSSPAVNPIGESPGATAGQTPPAPPGGGGPEAPDGAAIPYPTAFFGHPRGLATLFFTELWERFSYYGMRSLLILFMTADAVKGGLGFTAARAGAIYGLYTGSVYLAALPGGWVADRLLGQRRSVLLGGCFIAAGHFSLAINNLTTFFLGLVLIVIGTGLLKPNVSTMVGELYPDDSARRDAGFSIFYMGINIGATVSPFVCGWLGQKVNWHLGFAAAGVGMLAGLTQYILGGRYLGRAGLRPNAEVSAVEKRRGLGLLVGTAGVVLVLLLVLVTSGGLAITAQQIASGTTFVVLGIVLLYFVFQLAAGGLDRREMRRMLVVFLLFVFSALFWMGFEQAGSSLSLFAERLTDRHILGWDMPASWLQVVEPAFVILFAPVLAFLWMRLGRRNPSSPTKFGLGLLFGALAFVIMAQASLASVGHAVANPSLTAHRVGLWWLTLTYLLQALGELCLSPVGLSTVTKLAPHRKVSQVMGIWFMSLGLGNLLAGLVAGRFETFPLFQTFALVAAVSGAAGLILLLLARPIRSLMGGVN